MAAETTIVPPGKRIAWGGFDSKRFWGPTEAEEKPEPWNEELGMKFGMKKILLSLLGLAAWAAAVPASAADLPVYTKAPAMIAAIYDWSGVYVGLNGGGSWGISRFNFAVPGTMPVSIAGGMLGGTAGANYQIGHLVLGARPDNRRILLA